MEITEHAVAQVALKRKLLGIARKGDRVVVPDAFHFGPMPILIEVFQRLLESGVAIVLVKENIEVKPSGTYAWFLKKFCQSLQVAQRQARADNIQRGLLFKKMMCNLRLGGKKLDEGIRSEVVTLLEEGLSMRAIEKRLDRRVSRSTVHRIAREVRAKKK